MKMRSLAILTSFVAAGSAQAAPLLVAGWDFSQSQPGYISVDGGATETNQLKSNYSDLDANNAQLGTTVIGNIGLGVGADKGTMYVDGQYGSFALPLDYNGPVITNVPNINLNQYAVNGGAIPMGSGAAGVNLVFEVPSGQDAANELGLGAVTNTAGGGILDVVFGADLSALNLLGSAWQVAFAGKTVTGASSLPVEFSSDGVNYTPIGSASLSTTAAAFSFLAPALASDPRSGVLPPPLHGKRHDLPRDRQSHDQGRSHERHPGARHRAALDGGPCGSRVDRTAPRLGRIRLRQRLQSRHPRGWRLSCFFRSEVSAMRFVARAASVLLCASMYVASAASAAKPWEIADPKAPVVTSANLLESERFWPYQIELVSPWQPPDRATPLAAGTLAVLVRIENTGRARIDFGRDGLFEVPIDVTDLVGRANQIRLGAMPKIAPNLAHAIGPRLVDSDADTIRPLDFPATFEPQAFLVVFADPEAKSFEALARSLAPFRGRPGLLTVLLPQGLRPDVKVRDTLRALDWKVPFVMDQFDEGYTRSLLPRGTSIPAVMLLTREGRVLFERAWKTDTAAALASVIDRSLGGTATAAAESPDASTP